MFYKFFLRIMPTRTGKTMRTNLHEFHSWLKTTVQTYSIKIHKNTSNRLFKSLYARHIDFFFSTPQYTRIDIYAYTHAHMRRRDISNFFTQEGVCSKDIYDTINTLCASPSLTMNNSCGQWCC